MITPHSEFSRDKETGIERGQRAENGGREGERLTRRKA